MEYTIGRRQRIQDPIKLVRFSKGKIRIGREKYHPDTRGFDLDLAREMVKAGTKAGRMYNRATAKDPGEIRVYNMQTRLEVEID